MTKMIKGTKRKIKKNERFDSFSPSENEKSFLFNKKLTFLP